MGTSWISRKGRILEKGLGRGGGVDLEKGGGGGVRTPLPTMTCVGIPRKPKVYVAMAYASSSTFTAWG